ncbi:sugar ABC transporter substrate-binding protein [Bombiscardovia nodaiensis]|uniref:Sugar ABC transporter substrate-binding protein n=1 Tax=Bombiscardovia nodaiensis TaxID=2932181 RepID=A0ABN6SBY4_9BIFI|nr:sugar ABC transporter substrate-binding protein [Bombiscardovia nodaiensis]
MFAQDNKGVSVEGQFFEYGDYFQKLSVGAAGKQMPDIMQMDMNNFKQFKKNNLLLDMQRYIDNKTIDVSAVDKKVVSQGKLDGGMYGFTNAINAPALMYNKSLLDKLGITLTNDMTLEQFKDVSRQVYQKSGYKTNFAYYEPTDLLAYQVRSKGKILLKDGKLGVKSPSELEPFFQMYADGLKEGWHIDPKVFAEIKISSVEQNPLLYGSDPSRRSWCAFMYSSQSVAAQAAAQNGDKLAMVPWPSDNVSKSEYLKPSQYWVVSKNCKNPDLAAKWINFYINSVKANKILLTDRGLPISGKVLDAIKTDLTQPDQDAVDFIQKVVTPHSTEVNPPFPVGTSEIDTKTLPSVEEELCYGKIGVKEAAERFFRQANETLSNAR